MKKRVTIFASFALIFLISYFNSKFYLEDKNWKYNSGLNVGDYISYKDFSDETFHICFWKYLWIINSELNIGNYFQKEISSN